MMLAIALVVLASLGVAAQVSDGLLDLDAMIASVDAPERPANQRDRDRFLLLRAKTLSDYIKTEFVEVVRLLKLDKDDEMRLKHLDIINTEWTTRASDYNAQRKWFQWFHKDIDEIIDLVLQPDAPPGQGNPALNDDPIKRRWAEHGRRVGLIFDAVQHYALSAGGLPLLCEIDALLHLKKDLDLHFDETMGDFQYELNIDKYHPKFDEFWEKFQSFDVIPQSVAHLKQTHTECLFAVEALVNQASQIQKGPSQRDITYDLLNTLWAFCLDMFAIFLRVLCYYGVDTSRLAPYHQIGNHGNLFPTPPPPVTFSDDTFRDVKRRLALVAKRIADIPDHLDVQRPVLEPYWEPGQSVTSDMICEELAKIAGFHIEYEAPKSNS